MHPWPSSRAPIQSLGRRKLAGFPSLFATLSIARGRNVQAHCPANLDPGTAIQLHRSPSAPLPRSPALLPSSLHKVSTAHWSAELCLGLSSTNLSLITNKSRSLPRLIMLRNQSLMVQFFLCPEYFSSRSQPHQQQSAAHAIYQRQRSPATPQAYTR